VPARLPPLRSLRSTRSRPTRRDGWTIERQAGFLGLLAETGSVIGACEAIGMSRKSAYRLRALPGAESFAAAWDAALGMAGPKVTSPRHNPVNCNPFVRLVMFRGRYCGAWYNAANGDAVSVRRQARPSRVTRGEPDGDNSPR
jgi:hypothetical protein